ncbi:MAG: hypothetical protein JO125_07550 [Chloroflexi bacterium]|nr:hypothetical protein [Chloroflexota bacterium]
MNQEVSLDPRAAIQKKSQIDGIADFELRNVSEVASFKPVAQAKVDSRGPLDKRKPFEYD